ncbi:hypothetical protein HAX54_025420 [Datura stramonium]|uniref:Serine hydrolase domain-containing protein n=1 Tax=Datura stramonium TaxID=4076 RepID=A0ABS8UZD7_DATST|nr:hypothetical protein [Datura stramonium]
MTSLLMTDHPLEFEPPILTYNPPIQAAEEIQKEHPPMMLFVSISGAKFRDPSICNVTYKDVIKAKSVHFIGEKDWLKLPSQELTTTFDNPLITRHPQGHTAPRLGKSNEKLPLSFYFHGSCVGGGPKEASEHVNNENLEEGKKLEKPN